MCIRDRLFAAVADGTGMTMQPMISTYRAERDAPAVKRTLQLSAQYGSALALLVIAGLGLGAAPLCTLFGLSDASGKAGSLALRIYCISILPSLWNQIAIYYQQTTQRAVSYTHLDVYKRQERNSTDGIHRIACRSGSGCYPV